MEDSAKKKAVAKKRVIKSDIKLGEFKLIDKPIPQFTGRGSKYALIESLNVGQCIVFSPGSTNVKFDILKRAIVGAAKRRGIKVVCAVEPEGFCFWRKE